MEEREIKRLPLWEIILENAQTLGIVLGIMLGLRQPPKPGEAGPGGKEIPGWLLKIFSSLTKEDETEYNLILDSFPDGGIRPIEAEFRKDFIADGYDETDYRLSLVDLRREYMERLRNPAPEDKSGGRLAFTSITLRDSCTEFFSELLTESNTTSTPKEIFERQKKIALDRKILKKTGLLKRIFSWSQRHKLETILWIVLTPFLLVALIYQILNLLFG